MNNYLVYLVFGNDNFYNEVFYSILSYFKYHQENENQIIILTDNVAFFKHKIPHHIIYQELNEEKIKLWKGKINFVHRVKIKAIQEVSSHYSGNFLYLDTDTYFTENCSKIFKNINSNSIYFDKCEGKLIDNLGGIAKKMRKFLKTQNEFEIKSSIEKVKIDENFIVWNAGVIGFNSNSTKNLVFIEELVDVLYSKCRLFIMEQIAFNYFFQIETILLVADETIHHYWYFKEFRTVLTDFFNHNKHKKFKELILEIDKINAFNLSKEKREYKKMSFLKKQLHYLKNGRKWKIIDYKL